MKLLLFLALPFAVLLISFYVIRIAGLHKALRSISESDYWLKKPYKWTFEAVMFSVSLALIFTGWNFSAYLLISGGIGAALVGVFARFKKNKLIELLHWIGAFIIFISLTFSPAFDFNRWYLVFIPILAILWAYFYSKSNSIENNVLIWNVEVFGLYSFFITIYPCIVMELI